MTTFKITPLPYKWNYGGFCTIPPSLARALQYLVETLDGLLTGAPRPRWDNLNTHDPLFCDLDFATISQPLSSTTTSATPMVTPLFFSHSYLDGEFGDGRDFAKSARIVTLCHRRAATGRGWRRSCTSKTRASGRGRLYSWQIGWRIRTGGCENERLGIIYG
jgi:hypothetical protein